MKIFVALVVLAAAVNATLDCQLSSRFPWMLTPLSVGSPWGGYTSPNNKCCDVIDPMTPINFDEECALCYGRTLSTPGFMLDPNNCQKFYMCVPNGNGGFDAHSMTCPPCMFWDDIKLSCIEVDPICRVSVSVETGSPNPTFTPDPIVSCIDFENVKDLSTRGMYVFNNGVTVVTNGIGSTAGNFCPQGNNCGFFNASQLEIPFFSNNYNDLPNLKITFKMYVTSDVGLQGIISNDCLNNINGELGNSIVFTRNGGITTAEITDENNDITSCTAAPAPLGWVDVEINFDGTGLTLFINGTPVSKTLNSVVPFPGIRGSHCPLVIGSFINDAATSYFQGYLDNICFTIDYS